VRFLGEIENTPEAVRRLINKLASRHGELLFCYEAGPTGYGFIQQDTGGKDVFVHISAVERAGLRGLNEGQKVSCEVQSDRRTGKESAVDLKV
jgi:cold shock protein